jgi:hypothetical protein
MSFLVGEEADVLECMAGELRVGIPLSAVDHVTEYTLARPLPLGRPWLGGIGLDDQGILMSVDLSSGTSQANTPGFESNRRVSGVIVRGSRFNLRWAIEVSSVRAFIRVRRDARAARSLPLGAPRWILASVGPSGAPVGLVDIEMLVADFEGDG